ncbi:hypothetical protein [Rhizobium sp. LjRoot254]
MFDLFLEVLNNLLSIPSQWSKRRQWLIGSSLIICLILICLLAFERA